MHFYQLHRNVKIRIIEHFISVMVGNAIFPFMAIYFAAKLGPTITGFILLINVIISIICGLYGGHLADKFGRRIVMLKSGYIRLVATLLMVLASSPWYESPWAIYFSLIIFSACQSISRPASEAMIIDASTTENRKYIYSLRYWAYHVALIMGALGGALLFQTHLFELLLIITAISISSIILLKFFIVDTYIPDSEVINNNNSKIGITEIVSSYKVIIVDSMFKIYLLALLLKLCIETQFHHYSAVRFTNVIPAYPLFSFGEFTIIIDGTKMYAILNMVNAVIIICGVYFTKKILTRFTDRKLLGVGLLVYSTGYAIIATNSNPWILILAMCIITFGELLATPTIQGLLADIVPEKKRSSYLAINGLIFRGASIVGSLSITIGAYIPSWVIGIEIIIAGAVSMYFFGLVIKHRDKIASLVKENGDKKMDKVANE